MRERVTYEYIGLSMKVLHHPSEVVVAEVEHHQRQDALPWCEVKLFSVDLSLVDRNVNPD